MHNGFGARKFDRALAQRGEFHDSHGDDTSQLGGDFIVDKNGVLRLVYPSHNPADRPPVDELLKVLASLP